MSDYLQLDADLDPEFEALWGEPTIHRDLFPAGTPCPSFNSRLNQPPAYVPTPLAVLAERRQLFQQARQVSATMTSGAFEAEMTPACSHFCPHYCKPLLSRPYPLPTDENN